VVEKDSEYQNLISYTVEQTLIMAAMFFGLSTAVKGKLYHPVCIS